MLAAPTVDCRGYGLEMTPWRCIENQLSPMCLPGWPCEECEEGVTITAKVGQEASRKPQVRARNLQESGAPSLKKAKTRNYDPKTMSRAVARDLGLI